MHREEKSPKIKTKLKNRKICCSPVVKQWNKDRLFKIVIKVKEHFQETIFIKK